jgi:nucleoside-diphosphate-sugar epimerase
MMKRALITGATGFLGGAVARELRKAGWELVTTGRNLAKGAALEREGFFFTSCDLATEPAQLRQLVEGCEAVVHCAALSSPWGALADFQAGNVTATGNVLAACREAGARLVYISSPSVTFDFAHQRELREDVPWSKTPANYYIATKREAERLVQNTPEVAAIILRPKALIGPGDTTLLPRVIRVARSGFFPIFYGSNPRLDLTWIADAATAVRLALEAPERCRGKIYHITSGQPLAVAEALALLFAARGLRVRFIPIPTAPALALASALERLSGLVTGGRWEPPLTRYTVGSLAYEQSLDISAARRDLGYHPQKDIREALADCGREWRKGT